MEFLCSRYVALYQLICNAANWQGKVLSRNARSVKVIVSNNFTFTTSIF